MTVFKHTRRKVRVWREHGRWGVAVDGVALGGWFMSEAQAAGAGLLHVDARVAAMGAGQAAWMRGIRRAT